MDYIYEPYLQDASDRLQKMAAPMVEADLCENPLVTGHRLAMLADDLKEITEFPAVPEKLYTALAIVRDEANKLLEAGECIDPEDTGRWLMSAARAIDRAIGRRTAIGPLTPQAAVDQMNGAAARPA